jgi:photosynthesis system II assembly factor YCF48-like protein
VYAGTNNGVYVSRDGATTWTPLGGKTYRYEMISGLAFDPQSTATIYATSYYYGPAIMGDPGYGLLLKSTDGGATWQGINSCLPSRPAFGILADPGKSGSLYVASGSGVYKTSDGGASWTAMNDGLTSPYVYALGLVPGSPATLYAATSGGVFKTTIDAGGQAEQTSLCLNGRFRVGVTWRARDIGANGTGQAIPMTSDTGSFWFFSSNNLELVVKVLDGRAFNNKFWVFYGALSNVEYTITVTDTATGKVKTYFNPQGQLASVADTAAF